MESLESMLKELGQSVTIRCLGDLAYMASCGNVVQYGETAQGAVWNVLRVTRERSTNPAAPGAPIVTRKFMQHGIEVGEIPTAGQESY
jgi:hypothetical protein